MMRLLVGGLVLLLAGAAPGAAQMEASGGTGRGDARCAAGD